MKILGVDPGTATTGYGIIKKEKNGFVCLDYGIIATNPKHRQEKRLKEIYIKLGCVIKKYKPDLMSVEKLYFFKNPKTALPVSEARGIIILLGAQHNVPVKEITPLQVKMGVCGYGKATKKQVQEIVKKVLKLKETPKPDDAADALAAAYCVTNKIFWE